MARGSQPPARPELTIDQTRNVIERLNKRVAELHKFDPATVKVRFGSPELKALEAAIDETLIAAFGHGTPQYKRYSSATSLDRGPVSYFNDFDGRPDPTSFPEVFQGYVREGRDHAIALLQQAARGLEEGLPVAPAQAEVLAEAPSSNKVFIVHGHDELALQSLARFLEKIGLEAVILREMPDQGRTVIEKFEEVASGVGFVVVLLTPDDLQAATLQARARQNVIFELGFFSGKLGRGRVCLLRKGDVEMPSDMYGVIYTEMDDADGWKMRLVREFKAASLKFDANRLWE